MELLASHSDKETTLTRPNYRPDIDGLRGLAIICVVFYHAFPTTLKGGFIGVDVFFVISGYLIATIILASLKQGTFRFIEFYSRRIRRIFPSLLLVLLSCFIAGWFLLMPNDFKQLGKHMGGGASFIANFMFQQEAGYFDTDAKSKLLLNLWSLGIEEQFYIVFPLLVFAVFTFCFRNQSLVFPLILATASLSFVLNILKASPDTMDAFYSPLTRFWELLSGVLLAFTLPQDHLRNLDHDHAKADNIFAFTGLALIVVTAITYSDDIIYPYWPALAPVCAAILLIAAGPRTWVNHNILSNRGMVWVGLISYPLYLWHWPILSLLYVLKNTTPSFELRLLAVEASVFLAWVSWRYLENPIRGGDKNTVKVLTLSALMIGCAALGDAIYAKNGFPQRYPAIIQALARFDNQEKFIFQIKETWRLGRCYLSEREQQDMSFADECTDASHHPKLVIWGDSHAATFYSGFAGFAKESKFAVSQYTLGGCPPLLEYDSLKRPYCKARNIKVVEKIRTLKPDFVFLSADWHKPYYDVAKLEKTVLALQKLHIPHIVLIGPAPGWVKRLPSVLMSYWQNDALHRLPPPRSHYGLLPDNAAIDQKMRALSTRLGIDYLSIYDRLCNADGCLNRLGDDITQLTYFDTQHMTTSGAVYFASGIMDYFKQKPVKKP